MTALAPSHSRRRPGFGRPTSPLHSSSSHADPFPSMPASPPAENSSKTSPHILQLSRADSKMTIHSATGPAMPKSLDIAPVTPACSPRQRPRYSPRWQIPASPPSPLASTAPSSIGTVISAASLSDGRQAGGAASRLFAYPPRKSSISRKALPYNLSSPPSITTSPTPVQMNKASSAAPPAAASRTHQNYNQTPFRDVDSATGSYRSRFRGGTSQHDSLRSASTAATDRSSLFSKVSSIFDNTRPFTDDEAVMTVEEAIKMYEDGFGDDSDSSAPSFTTKSLAPANPAWARHPYRRSAHETTAGPLRKIQSAESLRPVSRVLSPTPPSRSRFGDSPGSPSLSPFLHKSKSSILRVPSQNQSRLSSELFIGNSLTTPTSSPVGALPGPGFPSLPIRAATMPNPSLGRSASAAVESVSFSTHPSPGNPRDRYGFKKQSQHVDMRDYDDWDREYSAYLERRRKKWLGLMKLYNLPTDNPTRFPPQTDRVKRYIRKGIPPDWRGNAWFWYSGGPDRLKSMSGLYARLVTECNSVDADLTQYTLPDDASADDRRRHAYTVDREHIERDLHRTFPDNILFKPDSSRSSPDPAGSPSSSERTRTNGSPKARSASSSPDRPQLEPPVETPILLSLRRVLRAFALHKPSIGYCQSLNFLAGLLLVFLNSDEERVFVMLDIITTDHLPGTHARMLEANVDVGVLMDLVRQELPSVWSKIDDSTGVSPPAIRADSIRSVSTVGRFRRRVTPSSAVPSFQRLQNRLGVSSGGGTIIEQASNTLPTVSLATTSWFMSLFIGSLPVEAVVRIWDSFFSEGVKALFRAALAIFRVCEPNIKALNDRMEVFQLIQTIPRSCLDVNRLIESCWRRRGGFGRVSRDAVEDRRQQRRQVVRGENEARLDAESASPSRAASPPSSPPVKPVKPAVRVGLAPAAPTRSVTMNSPHPESLQPRPPESIRRQATFS